MMLVFFWQKLYFAGKGSGASTPGGPFGSYLENLFSKISGLNPPFEFEIAMGQLGLPSEPTFKGAFKVPETSAPVWHHAQNMEAEKSLKTMIVLLYV